MRWHAAAQDLLRGKPYRPYEEIVAQAASSIGLDGERPSEFLSRWTSLGPWPAVPEVPDRPDGVRCFTVRNCPRPLGRGPARPAGRFALVFRARARAAS